MQIHQTFTNNFRPSNIKEARDYATTLSTIREIDSFPANVATYNQQPADLDPSKFGVALPGAPLLQEVYRKTMGPDCLKIVRDFEAATPAVSGEI